MESKSVDLNKIVEVNDEEEFRHNTNEKELTIETPEKKNMEKSRIVQKKLDKKEKINKIRNTVCKKPIEVNLECKECGYKGKSQRSMRIHKRDNTHKKSLKCNECNIEVQTEKTLKFHKNFKHQIHTCDQCDFEGKYSMVKAHREKNHVDVILDKSLLKPENNLWLKLFKNKNQASVKCNLCEYIGISDKSLRFHQHNQHIHDNIPLVGTKREFNQELGIPSSPPIKMKKKNSALGNENAEKSDDHIKKKHKEEKIKDSSQIFENSNPVNSVKNTRNTFTVTTDKKCSMCDFIYKSKVDLENHTKSVHKEAQLEKNVEKSKCDDCDEVFTTNKDLLDHKGSKHETNNASIILEQGPKPLKNLRQIPKELKHLSRYKGFFTYDVPGDGACCLNATAAHIY